MGDNWVAGALAGALFILVVVLMIAAVFDLVRRRRRRRDWMLLVPKPPRSGGRYFGPLIKCDPDIVRVYVNGQHWAPGSIHDYDPKARRFYWLHEPQRGDEIFIKADIPESHNIRSEFWLDQGWMEA